MATKLDKTLKREIDIDGAAYMVAISPEGVKLTQKGFRKGPEMTWKQILVERRRRNARTGSDRRRRVALAPTRSARESGTILSRTSYRGSLDSPHSQVSMSSDFAPRRFSASSRFRSSSAVPPSSGSPPAMARTCSIRCSRSSASASSTRFSRISSSRRLRAVSCSSSTIRTPSSTPRAAQALLHHGHRQVRRHRHADRAAGRRDRRRARVRPHARRAGGRRRGRSHHRHRHGLHARLDVAAGLRMCSSEPSGRRSRSSSRAPASRIPSSTRSRARRSTSPPCRTRSCSTTRSPTSRCSSSARTPPPSCARDVSRLLHEGAKGIVLDLRSNPGGILDQGLDIADLFLKDPGRRSRASAHAPGPPQVFTTHGGAAHRRRSARRARRRLLGVRERDRHRRAAGSRSRARRRHDVVRQGARADGVPARRWLGDEAHHRQVVHAEWPLAFRRIASASIRLCRSVQRPMRGGRLPDSLEQDSVKKHRPAYKSDAGRTVYGGGGITPDVIVPEDTVDHRRAGVREGDRAQVSGASGRALQLRLRAQGPRRKDFTVTPAVARRALPAPRSGQGRSRTASSTTPPPRS